MEPNQVGSVSLNVEGWKIKTREKRNNRMRIQINLSKDEAEAVRNFKEIFGAQGVSDDQFMHHVFMMGLQTLDQQLQAQFAEYVSANKEELAASGISVIENEDGGVSLVEAEDQPEA